VQLVHQAVDEQVVPELPAQLQQDGAPRPCLERGDLRVEVRAADDAGGVLPRRQIFLGDGVGDDVLLRDADELRELAPDRGTAEGVRSNVLLTDS
jgi:hypothetical protein